jgi:MFS superfamily sulfate permease-like transporter
VPLLLFALYTTSQYLQVGAVAIVSLLTYEAVTKLVAPQAAAVAALKTAASAAAKAASAQRLNATLTAADFGATAAYNAANVALIQTQIDTASLLAFFVGVFSLGIGFLKLGSVMNLMGPSVISGFQTAASVTIALGQFKNLFGYGASWAAGSVGCCSARALARAAGRRCCVLLRARVPCCCAHRRKHLHHACMQTPARRALTLRLRCRQGLHRQHHA